MRREESGEIHGNRESEEEEGGREKYLRVGQVSTSNNWYDVKAKSIQGALLVAILCGISNNDNHTNEDPLI